MPKKPPAPTGRKVSPKTGVTRVVLQLKPEQLSALVAEATRRRDERGGIRVDVSEVAREALDTWMKKQAR